VPVEEDREAELAGQDHRPGRRIVEQDRDPVAAVVGLADLPGDAAVTMAVVERRLAQDVPVVRQHLDVEVADPVVVPEVDAVAAAHVGAP
jgi:hypothetical protein